MDLLSHDTSQTAGFDLLSFAFNGPVKVDQQKPLYIDAGDPTQTLNAAQLKVLVRKLIAGFRTAQLPKGGRVLVHLFNHVGSTVSVLGQRLTVYRSSIHLYSSV